MYDGYQCILLVLATFLLSGVVGQDERSTLRVTGIYGDRIDVYFYQFNMTVTPIYDYVFELQYRNLSTEDWTERDSFNAYSSTSVRQRYHWISGLQSNTEYAIRVVLKKDDIIIWQTSTLVVRTKPPDSRRHLNKAYNFSHYGSTAHHKKTFAAAEEFCVTLGGHLASLLNSDETDFVHSTIDYKRGEYWIGLQFTGQDADYCNSCKLCYLGIDATNNCELCETCRSEWKWTDGSPMVYQNWEIQQPNGNARCGIFNVDKKWYDASCDSSHYFVCAKVISCPHLKPPENGLISLSYSNYGSRAQYSCKDGYRLVGDEYRHCYDFGSSIWLGEAPTCIEDADGWMQDTATEMATSTGSPEVLTQSTSPATYDKEIAIGLFVGAVVFLLVGGTIILVCVFRRINAFSEKMTVLEQGVQRKKTNAYQNDGFKGGTTPSSKPRETKEKVTEKPEEEYYQDLE